MIDILLVVVLDSNLANVRVFHSFGPILSAGEIQSHQEVVLGQQRGQLDLPSAAHRLLHGKRLLLPHVGSPRCRRLHVLDALLGRVHPGLLPILSAVHRGHEVPLHREELVGQEDWQQQVIGRTSVESVQEG